MPRRRKSSAVRGMLFDITYRMDLRPGLVQVLDRCDYRPISSGPLVGSDWNVVPGVYRMTFFVEGDQADEVVAYLKEGGVL